MAQKPITIEQLVEAQDAVAVHGSLRAAAQALGISRSALRNRLAKADKPEYKTPTLKFPTMPDDDIPTEDIIDVMCRRHEKRRASYDAHTWFRIKVRDPKPIGVLWFGDQHVDDPGCDWPLLRRHAQLCAETDGLYGGNIGDLHNNWIGRLEAKYADQDTSKKTAYKLAKWLILESGVEWLVTLLGNHDMWGDGGTILKEISGGKVLCHDWEARFILEFPNGREVKVYAAHDFKGNSIWNDMHGPLRASKLGERADLFICGHKHTWGTMKCEHADRGHYAPALIRLRGYKGMDEYARRYGYAEQREGSSILTIIDPNATPAGLIDDYIDIEKGVKMLKVLRAE